jgi:DNA-binding transcriptional LysR family regulator
MLNEIDLSRVDLNLFVVFEAVFEERHVGRAAQRLKLSPSAISHGLGRLRGLLNDPLFLKHPKGVVPTARAEALAEVIGLVLVQARRVVGSADPFDARRSTRKFTIGAPDGIGAVVLPATLAAIRGDAPGIDVSIRDMQPLEMLAALDARVVDVALYPLDDMPVRCTTRVLYEEDFVVAARGGHPFAAAPTLESYCKAQHLLVSRTGDARGFVDQALAELGVSRRVMLTVPSFLWGLAIVAESDLLAALPRSLVRAHGERFGVVGVEAPADFGRFRIHAVARDVAMMDLGITWLMEVLERSARGANERKTSTVVPAYTRE